STITMQLARNVSFSLERRFLRKFKEMLLALKIEQELSKEEILELYINVVAFGKRAYGAQAAAYTYYGKPLKALDLPQLAMLAGVPQAPSAANPINGPSRALARRNLVLSRMYAQGSINEMQYNQAIDAPISAGVYARELDVHSPYAAEWVRQQGLSLLPDLYTGGYEITTTINSSMQKAAIEALRNGLVNYDHRHGYRGPESQVTDEALDLMQQAAPLALNAYNGMAESPAEDATTDDSATQLEAELENEVKSPSAMPVIHQPHTVFDYPAELHADNQAMLAEFRAYGDLEPALIVAVGDDRAVAQRTDGSWVGLRYADADWARPYVHVDLRDPLPESMQGIVAIGDLVRISTDDKQQWQLAQLPDIQGALVSLDPNNGAVRALVGGFDFYQNQYNHALQAARQPGSGFKPFVYSAALASGVTPADIFMDAPLVFDDENLESQYRPDNDNNRYNGPTRLREALYRSINLVSIRVLMKIGAGHVLDYAPNFGFRTNNFPRNTQLAIGGGTMAVTPMEMARAYAVLANQGYLIDPYIVSEIRNSQGTRIYLANHPVLDTGCAETQIVSAEPASEEDTLNLNDAVSLDDILLPTDIELTETLEDATAATDSGPLDDSDPVAVDVTLGECGAPDGPIQAPQVIDERNAFIMHSMLQDVIKRGTGRRALALQREDLAGKTGTTNDAADTWFNGYSSDLVTTVWVGFSNHAPLGARAYGSNTPLPIWVDYMQAAQAKQEAVFLPQPSGIVTMKINPETGEPANPGQRDAIFEYFLSENAPSRQITSNPQNDDDVKAIDLF
ncbi:MAG: transglycosylase domain-containing protein, partial [Pseudomonadota bacterium]